MALSGGNSDSARFCASQAPKPWLRDRETIGRRLDFLDAGLGDPPVRALTKYELFNLKTAETLLTIAPCCSRADAVIDGWDLAHLLKPLPQFTCATCAISVRRVRPSRIRFTHTTIDIQLRVHAGRLANC